MSQFYSFIVKEIRHILRDKRTMLILFGMPVVMMVLFGFALSQEVRNVRTVIVSSSTSDATRSMVDALSANDYFSITHNVPTPADAEALIRSQQADIAIVFAPDFASSTSPNHALLQVITDGTDPNMAQMYANYATQIISSHFHTPAPSFQLHTTLLYNPQMRSCYNFVPGIMGMLMILICAMMTSISIVREKETGTMEVLLVSPIRPFTIIIAKVIPYLVLAFLILTAILLISRFILGVPIAGSLLAIYLLSGVYILTALSIGILISTIAQTQLSALIMSAMLLIMPNILLSGMIYPIESMPQILQFASYAIPPRYYISAIRKLMIMGVSINNVIPEILTLIAMTALLLSLALKNFNKRLA